MPQASPERIGRYSYFGFHGQSGLWLGIHFGLWKKYGLTPLWVVFSGNWGRTPEVQALLEPWAAQNRIFAGTQEDGCFVVALDIAFGEDKDRVVAGIVSRLSGMAACLNFLKLQPAIKPESCSDNEECI